MHPDRHRRILESVGLSPNTEIDFFARESEKAAQESVEPPEMGNGPQAAIPLGPPAVRRFGPYDWACKKSA